MNRVIGVLNGGDVEVNLMSDWLTGADHIFAADGAADLCLALGFRPTVVGDLDSIESSTQGLRVEQVIDQELTDFEKLLQVAAADGHKKIVLAGLEGDRPDHILAGFSALTATGLEVDLVYRSGLGKMLNRSEKISLSVPSGTDFSVIPMPSATVTVTGAQWPLERASLGLGSRVSISNRTLGVTTIEVHEGCVFLYVCKQMEPWSFPWTPTG